VPDGLQIALGRLGSEALLDKMLHVLRLGSQEHTGLDDPDERGDERVVQTLKELQSQLHLQKSRQEGRRRRRRRRRRRERGPLLSADFGTSLALSTNEITF
jgi:hypothetical protein